MTIAVVYYHWQPAGDKPFVRFIKSYLRHPAGIAHDLVVLPRREGWDIAHLLDFVQDIRYDQVCFLNAYSEILKDDWLAKLHGGLVNLDGLVGATGSYENRAHIRTTGFLMDRDYLSYFFDRPQTKEECLEFESGPHCLTSRTIRPVVVNSDGDIFLPSEWWNSGTYRQGNQEKLLIGDNQTRHYEWADEKEREKLRKLAWGDRVAE